MDAQSRVELSGWIVAIIALATLWLMVRFRSQDMTGTKMQESLKPINETLARFEGHHTRHFQETRVLAEAVTRVTQQVSDHERTCEQRDRRIEGMFSEIRNILMNGSGR